MPTAGAAPWGDCFASVSADLTQLLLPLLWRSRLQGGESFPSLQRGSAMGEWFAGSAGICWVQAALQVLDVSEGFVRGAGAGCSSFRDGNPWGQSSWSRLMEILWSCALGVLGSPWC